MTKYSFVRGGSWSSNARNVRSANRIWFATARRINRLGFRIVRSFE